MKQGDLVMNIYTREIGIITRYAVDSNEYVEVLCPLKEYLIPIEHLEVISEA